MSGRIDWRGWLHGVSGNSGGPAFSDLQEVSILSFAAMAPAVLRIRVSFLPGIGPQ